MTLTTDDLDRMERFARAVDQKHPSPWWVAEQTSLDGCVRDAAHDVVVGGEAGEGYVGEPLASYVAILEPQKVFDLVRMARLALLSARGRTEW